MRVLVVQDEVRMAWLLRRALKEEGHAVDVAVDGPQGLWLATENELLEFFLRHPGQVLTRSAIIEAVWDFAYDGGSNVCGLAETARVVRYLAGESAGQCGPCRFGLAAVAGELERIAEGRTADPGLLRRWLGQVDGRGGCAHPSGVVRLAGSALRTFGTELSQHAGGSCGGTARVLPVPSPGPR